MDEITEQLTKNLTQILSAMLKKSFQQATDRLLKEISNENNELPSRLATLTKREREVLNLMAQGNEFSNVPKILDVSPKTIEAHRWNIQKKLKLSSSKDIKKIVVPWLQRNK